MLQTLEVSELLVSEVGVKCNLHSGNLRCEDRVHLETYQTQYFKGLTVLTSSLSPFFFFMNEMSHQEFYQLIR